MYNFAQVIINSDALQVDKPFTYKIRPEMREKIKIGYRVLVCFGAGNKKVEGFVIGLLNDVYEKKSNIKYKYITKLCDEEALLTEDDFKIVNFLREKYMCKYIDAIRILIPYRIMEGNTTKTKSAVFFSKEIDNMTLQQKEALNHIKKYSGKFNKIELTTKTNISAYMINKLIKLGALEIKEIDISRIVNREFPVYPPKKLNEEQINAYDKILDTKKSISLLNGVTGSGKTEVYMNLVSYMLLLDKTCLILVPEISLTPQMIERFKGRFGNDVAVFHSKLSTGERYDQWYRVKNREVSLVVGTRSALFLPFKDLGLIIVDEEHDRSYKSDMNPKYNTIEVCEFFAKIKGCKVVLGSATPSIESFYKALNGEYELVMINKRANNKKLPSVELVDMREELKNNNKSIFSRKLFEKINDRLNKNEQIILFLNRRGFSTFVSCRSCGYVFKCENCDISMTYHNNGYLVCHYCGRREKIKTTCPKCGSSYVKYFGAGTEKVQEIVKKYFPNARVLRLDVDTTRRKNSYEAIYNSFKNKEADILIGTQMVTKGFDFENVTLVGVITADMALNLPDYRSSERTFQMLTQVSGRAGRGEKAGEVIIQTYSPQNYAVYLAKDSNYNEFFKREIVIRKSLDYPPFSKILIINMAGESEKKIEIFSKKLKKSLQMVLKGHDEVHIYNPSACPISKINNIYRWQMMIKGNFSDIITDKIKKNVYENTKNIYNEIRVSLDINPNSLM